MIAAEPHPFGSPRQLEIARHLEARSKSIGFETHVQTFNALTPDPSLRLHPEKKLPPRKVTGQNVWAKTPSLKKDRCVVLLASHYDSKDIDGMKFVGANDGGSSSVVLLQALAAIKQIPAKENTCAVWGVWFDGEESVLSQWDDAEAMNLDTKPDNTYGSRHVAASLRPCGKAFCLPDELGGHPVRALVLLDLVGAPGLTFTQDANSDPALRDLFADTAKHLSLGERLSTGRSVPIGDDHIPFRDLGMPVINLIDFEHLEAWHRESDIASYVKDESLEIAWRLATALSVRIAAGD